MTTQILMGMTDCPTVRALITRGELALDYLEVHGPYIEDARRCYPEMPMLLHNALYQWSLTHPDGLAHMECARLTAERLKLAASPWYSLHLGFSAETVDFWDEAMQALTTTLPPETIFERACQTLTDLAQIVKVPLLLENLDYNPTGAYETICQPEFINGVLEATGTELLLDLAHARISAAALNMTVQAYISQLPLLRVRQIHINSPRSNSQRLWDAHEAMQSDDYELLDWVLARCRPWAITLEYNKDEALILEQIRLLRKIILAGQPKSTH